MFGQINPSVPPDLGSAPITKLLQSVTESQCFRGELSYIINSSDVAGSIIFHSFQNILYDLWFEMHAYLFVALSRNLEFMYIVDTVYVPEIKSKPSCSNSTFDKGPLLTCNGA